LEEREIEVFEQASQPALLENNVCCEQKDTNTIAKVWRKRSWSGGLARYSCNADYNGAVKIIRRVVRAWRGWLGAALNPAE